MDRTAGYAMAMIAALALGGCSETAFMDTLGLGKNAPDERLVSTNPPLSVPPDMQLRPPGEGAAANTPSQVAAARDDLSSPPVGGAPAAQASYQRQAAATNTAATGAAAADNGSQSSFYKRYTDRGISLYHPDGRKKKIYELNRELAEKIKEEKRRQNPNYGTIFNVGGLLKD